MTEVAAGELELPLEAVVFSDGRVGKGSKQMDFGALATQCWLQQISLSATGYYATPGIVYDRDAGQGTPFFYFAYGGAVCEVEVHGLTGEHRLLRVDILHDVGNPLVPTIDIGQVEGAFVQGQGWLTCEEVCFGADGRLLTHSPSTYKIPTAGDVAADFRTALLERAPNDKVVGGSKAVGEPPFMLAIGAVTALRHAARAFGPTGHELVLRMPCTPEAILRAVEDARKA
jgi:xanthine dehydrogenase large subunit